MAEIASQNPVQTPATPASQAQPAGNPAVPNNPAAPEGGDADIEGHIVKMFGRPSAEIQAALTEVNDLRVKAATRYSTPLVERIDKLAQGGASVADIQRFFEIQSLDVANMSPEQSIIAHFRFGKNLTQDQAAALFRSKFPALAENADADAKLLREVELKEAAENAAAYFKENQAEHEPAKPNEADVAQEKVMRDKWANVAATLPKTASIEVARDGKPYYKLDYNPSLTDAEAKYVNETVINFAITNKLPFDGASVAQLDDVRRRVIINLKMDDLLDTMLRDVESSFTESAAARYSNSGGGNPQNPNPSIPATTYQPRKGFG